MFSDSWRDLSAQWCSVTGNQHSPVTRAGTEQSSPCNPAERQGWESEEWLCGKAQLCLYGNLFFSSVLSVGRQRWPKGAVSPVHLVLHQFFYSKIKIGKGSGGRPGEYKATLWLQFAPHQSSSQAQLEMCPQQS